MIKILLRERERKRKAKEYYDAYYIEYFADEILTFTGEEPSYPTSINKVSCGTNGFPVHFINILTVAEMSEKLGKGKRTVKRALKELIYNGYICRSGSKKVGDTKY